jgi:hypothetical protein
MKKRNELVTQAGGTLATKDRPGFLAKQSERKGLEQIERADLVLPRLSICQSMSPQRKKSDPLFIKDLEEGQFFNTVTDQIYGSGALRVIPLLFGKSRLYFKPFDEGGGLLCQSMNGKTGGSLCPTCEACPKQSWGEDGEKPACTLLYNYPSVLLPSFELIVVSMKVTSLKAARQWNTLMRFRNADAFAGVYELRAIEAKNTLGTYFVFNVKPSRWANETEYKQATAIYESIQDQQVRPSTVGLAQEERAETAPQM